MIKTIKTIFIWAFLIAIVIAAGFDHDNPATQQTPAIPIGDDHFGLEDMMKHMEGVYTADTKTKGRWRASNYLRPRTFYLWLPMWIGIILCWIINIGRDEH